jgi:hypothetical protein
MSESFLSNQNLQSTQSKPRLLVNYLVGRRLQWGRPDRLSVLTSGLTIPDEYYELTPEQQQEQDPPEYFTAEISPRWVSIITNDWPYSSEPQPFFSM